VQSNSAALVRILIAEKIDVNSINAAGHSPLSLYFVAQKSQKGLSHMRISLRSLTLPNFGENMVAMLAQAGANFNHIYNDYKEPSDPKAKEETASESTYQSTILIN
jgi:hypothetical protein